MKRVLCLMLSLMLLVGLVPMQAMAASYQYSIWLGTGYNYVQISHEQAFPGTIVTVTPNAGYTITSMEVVYGEAEFAIVTPGDPSYSFIMPEGNASVYVTVSGPRSVFAYCYIGAGNPTAPSTAMPGSSVTIEPNPEDGYVFDKMRVDYVDSNGQEHYDEYTDTSFVMPDADVQVCVSYKTAPGFDPSTREYAVRCAQAPGGSFTSSHTNAKAGETITIATDPDDGYVVSAVYAIGGPGGLQPVTKISKNTYTFVMPASDIDVTVVFTAGTDEDDDDDIVEEYLITCLSAPGGSYSCSRSKAKAGETITIVTYPSSGYELESITATCSGTPVTVTGGKFTMPAGDVTVTVTFKAIQQDPQDPPASQEYNVTVTPPENGSASATPTKAKQGEKITVTATPNSGYELDKITATCNGEAVTVSGEEFTMPAGDVTVTATFKAIQQKPQASHTTNPNSNAFKANIDLTNQAVVDMLVTADDLASGQDVRVYMEVEELTSSAVPSGDKTAITSKATGRKIAAFLDIRLMKQIGNENPKPIINTGNNMVPITMKLTDAVIPSGAGKDSFSIIYHHVENGTTITEEIPATFDASTKILTFKANKFSTYALVLKDKVPGGTLDKVPKSGDISGLNALPLLLLCCAVTLAGVAIYDKKRAR